MFRKEDIMKNLLLLCASIACAFFICANAQTSAEAAESVSEEPVQGELYKRLTYYAGNDEFQTEDSETYIADGTPYEIMDCVILTINDCGTKNDIEDDEVVSTKLKQKFYDVPLDVDLQDHIMKICEQPKYKRQVSPVQLELVLAIIEVESSYNADAIGDEGKSFGLMQIKQSDHEERMERLGVADLMNPYENVIVGIDILNEKLLQYHTLGEALTAYNAGDTGAEELYFSQGVTMSPYAEEVWKAWRRICMSYENE